MATVAIRPARLRLYRFKQPAHLLFVIVATEFIGSTSLALSFGFRPSSVWTFLPHLYCVLLIACGPLSRRIGMPRLAGSCETVGFLYGQGLALFPLLFPMTALAGHFADSTLVAADKMLGFDWRDFAGFFRSRRLALEVMTVSYFSFDWQGALILPLLFATSKGKRAWTTIFAANLALVLTILIYPWFPAIEPFEYFGISPAQYPNMSARAAWLARPAIEAIRDHHARLITPQLMVPLVTFPSYHAVAALLLGWAAWPLRWLRWPIVSLNVMMALSALIIGAHYLVDLVAGALIALLAIRASMITLRLVSPLNEPKECL